MSPESPSLDRIAALVPVRGLEGSKARLGEVLDTQERRELVERLLRQTVEAAAATPGVVAVAVVSPDPEALAVAAELGADGVRQAGLGLNEGLAEGRAWAIAGGAGAILVVPGDLPAVEAAELGRVIGAARGLTAAGPGSGAGPRPTVRPLVALVHDRAGTGTNLLLVAPPSAIAFRFGEGSRAAHSAEARAAGASYLEVDSPLSLDLDTAADLLAAEEAGLGAYRSSVP